MAGLVVWALICVAHAAYVPEIEVGIEQARGKAAALHCAVQEAEAAGVDTSYERATLAVADLFFKWIRWDALHVEDTVAKYRMWRIIDQQVPDVHAEAAALPARMLKRTHEMLDRALKELCAHRADPRRRPGLFPRDIRDGVFRNDYLYVDGRPVFPAGFNLQLNDQDVRNARAVGADLVNLGPRLHELFPDGWDVDQDFIAYQKRHLDDLHANGMMAEVHLKGIMRPKFRDWFLKTYPDITRARGHFFEIDIEHPGAWDLVSRYAAVYDEVATGHPGVQNYLLINEIGFPLEHSVRSPLFLARFAAWAEAAYGTIDALNESWGATYTAFADIRFQEAHKRNPAAWYDWCAFNKQRVTDFVRRYNDEIKSHNPKALTYVKVVNETTFAGSTLHGNPREYSVHSDGVDREALAEFLDLNGCDTRILPDFPFHIEHPWYDKDRYALHWISQGIAFDFMKSIAPDKPLYDGEWHSMQTLGYRDPDIPGDHLRASLWHAHLSGMAMNIIWAWTRGGPAQEADGQRPTSSAYAGLLNQPQLLEAYAHGMIEVNAFAGELIAFARAPRPIRILYSEASAIQDMSYLDKQLLAYEALFFTGVPIGFVTERMLAREGMPGDCAWLIIPGNNHVQAETVTAIEQYVADGGHALIIGDAALRLTPRGRPHDPDRVAFVETIPHVSPAQAESLLHAMRAHRPESLAEPIVSLRAMDGTPMPFGVFWRTTEHEGKTLAFAMNVSRHPLQVHWARGGKPLTLVHDLIANRDVPATLSLPPKGFGLFSVGPEEETK